MIEPLYIHILSVLMFCVAIVGIVINLHNIIKVFLCVELMFLAVSINFVGYAYQLGDIKGQALVIVLLTVAAAESAIGLAILVYYFRVKSTVSVGQSEVLRD
jgi:NADH-quinone oxidoreductase subunit K